MNIHEYQAKSLLKDFGILVPKGKVAFSLDEAATILKELTPPWVVKAQIHAGGRGKAGGVKVSRSAEEILSVAQRLIGNPLVTNQTGPEGQIVRRVYIEEGCNIKKEYYLSLLLDRSVGRITVVASSEGGMDIEQVAKTAPEKIVHVSIDPTIGYQPFYGRQIAYKLDISQQVEKQFFSLIASLCKMFIELDLSLLELNPMVETVEGQLLCLDAKMSFDDNALYRHPDIKILEDTEEIDPLEKKANENGLSYIKLNGDIGCMVNGAGLAMATMDLVKLYGGEPANFLDVGGGATRERITEAFKIIISDKQVKGIFVNIFGGIMRCEIIAEGIIEAARSVSLNLPVVVRLEGTNVNLGKEIIENSGLPITVIDDFASAAKRIIEDVKRGV